MVQIHSPQPFLLGSLTTHEKAEERMVQDQEVSGSIRLAPDSVKSPFQLVLVEIASDSSTQKACPDLSKWSGTRDEIKIRRGVIPERWWR